MNLKRLSPEVQHLADSELLRSLQPHDLVLADYELDLDQSIILEALDDALRSFRKPRLQPEDDSEMASAVRRALPLDPGQAADPSVWWWLALCRYPDIARARWADASGDVKAERMLGGVGRNAFARLWWGAEMVRDHSERLPLLFRNQDLFEAVIGRKLGRHQHALAVILERLSDKPGRLARETIRDLRQLLSTVVLEALSEEQLATEIDRLFEARQRAFGEDRDAG